MKVKDAVQIWLLVPTKSGRPLYKNHFFPTKGKSICGREEHPKTQPNALFVQNEDCKGCFKKAPKPGLERV